MMNGTRILSALLALMLSACLVASADARKWRSRHVFGFHTHDYSRLFVNDDPRARAAEAVETARARTGGGAIGAVIDRLVRGCVQQAAQFQNWPFDEITRIVVPDEAQRGAMEALRTSAIWGAERLSAGCPQDAPAPPEARLETVQQAIDIATSTFDTVEPSLRTFYAALDDEQKARLLRDLTLTGSRGRDSDRYAERSERRNRWRGDAARGDEGNAWASICERLAAALRGWPIREIDRGVRLSEPQRVAFYDLVNSSLKAADKLAGTCPAETALTAPVRMASLRARLFAVREAVAAIRPALAQFYEALDQEQKVRFAAMR